MGKNRRKNRALRRKAATGQPLSEAPPCDMPDCDRPAAVRIYGKNRDGTTSTAKETIVACRHCGEEMISGIRKQHPDKQIIR